MPLVVATLASKLEQLFAQPPATRIACAQAWADAVAAYASGVIPPSTTVSSAKATLAAALDAAFGAPDPATVATQMEAAFLAFATTVGTGMAPTFAGTPPPAPIGIASIGAQQPATHAAAAQAWATPIDAWMHTGIATLVAPPFTPQTWA